jgi:hypothetical protein
MLSRAAELARRELVGEQRGMDEARGRLDELSGRRVRNLGLLHEGLLTEGDFREANRALVEEEEALRATLIPALAEPTLRALEALASEPPAVLLDRLRSLPVETQILTLRSAFSRVEIHPHCLRFYHVADLIPPVTRPLPRYWSPSRGCTDLGW